MMTMLMVRGMVGTLLVQLMVVMVMVVMMIMGGYDLVHDGNIDDENTYVMAESKCWCGCPQS